MWWRLSALGSVTLQRNKSTPVRTEVGEGDRSGQRSIWSEQCPGPPRPERVPSVQRSAEN